MHRCARSCTTIGVVLVLSLTSAIDARQQPAFRSRVEVVLIDVNVVDRQGKPVASLKPEDFVVSVDRKPRKIVSAQFIDYTASTRIEREARPTESRSPLDALATAPPSARPRTVLLVFDEDNLDVADGLNARKAAETFLERFGPTDRIGVATLPNLHSSVALTTNRADVRKSIEAVITGNAPADNPTEFVIGLSEAFAVELGDGDMMGRLIRRNCTANDPGCPDEVRMTVRQMQLQARLRGQRIVDGLRDLGEGLQQIEGPKTVLFIAGGMPMPDARSVAALTRLGESFAAAQVTLYTIYMRREQFGQVKNRMSPTPMEDVNLERDGAENATSAAGGTVMEAIGTLDQYFDRVAREISASYLLGIEVAAADRDGRPHAVQVKVNRANVDVRARKQYVIEAPKPEAKRAGAAVRTSAAAHAARLAARPAPLVPDLESVTPELVALLVRAGQFALDYQPRIDGLLGEEEYDQALSKWKDVAGSAANIAASGWVRDQQRHMKSEYLLTADGGQMAWQLFRDPFEVDGKQVRDRGRLASLFESRSDGLQQAAAIMTEASRFNLGFGNRNVDAPPLALVLLTPANRDRFFFRKEGEEEIGATSAWRLSFVETGATTTFIGYPLCGTVWIEPQQGRLVRSTLRLNMEDVDAEITVTYAPAADLDGLWVPGEVRETYTSDTQKLETVAKYSKFRLLTKM